MAPKITFRPILLPPRQPGFGGPANGVHPLYGAPIARPPFDPPFEPGGGMHPLYGAPIARPPFDPPFEPGGGVHPLYGAPIPRPIDVYPPPGGGVHPLYGAPIRDPIDVRPQPGQNPIERILENFFKQLESLFKLF